MLLLFLGHPSQSCMDDDDHDNDDDDDDDDEAL